MSTQVREWESRFGWTDGLVSEDPALRTAALARYVHARDAERSAFRAYNRAHRLNPGAHFCDPVLAGPRARYDDARSRWFPDMYDLWFLPAADRPGWPGLRYALNYLEWEARYPEEWTRYAKGWGLKRHLLRRLGIPGHSAADRARLAGMLELALARPYRCEDRHYGRVARAVDSAALRERLRGLAESGNPWARLRTPYVLSLLEDPARPDSPAAWRSHLGERALPPR